jgi:protein-S-isoprenylcysteine O-methyltransferase Ste14
VTKIILFLVGSLVLAWVSRVSLRRPGSHGFYRFFAWECILALFVINFRGVGAWFADPFCPRQLLSWTLLFGSIVPVGWGAMLLRTRGGAGAVPDGRELYGFEKTTQLVTVGLFKYIRHPLYCSLLLLAWGVFAKRPSWAGLGLALAATALLVGTAKAEEVEDRAYFGTAYEAYMRRSKMFVPFVL